MTDEYTLPKDHACYATLEGYKDKFGHIVDEFWQVKQYQKYAPEMERWQHCCPGGEQIAAEFRPRLPDQPLPETVFEITPPALFDRNIPCATEIYRQGVFSFPKGYKWLEKYDADREKFWEGQFFRVSNQLHDCCMQRDQEQAAAERLAAETKQQSGQPPGPRREAEATRSAQTVAACENELARLRTERGRCEQQAQLAEATYGKQLAALTGERDSTRRSLQALRDETAPRPGIDALAAFPSGAVSPDLMLLGVLALTAGLLLGLLGRTRQRSRMVAAGRSGGIALGVYLAIVALLPDTQPAELLLALTVAVLVVALRAVVRSLLELGPLGPVPPAP